MTRIWLALVALTLAEVALAKISLPATVMVALLLLLSTAKAGIIGWWFMHLRQGRPKLFQYLLPMLLLCIVLLFALLPDGWRAGAMR